MKKTRRKEKSASFKPRAMIKGRQPLGRLAPLSTPIVVTIDPSSVCNLKCAFCPNSDQKLIGDIKRYQGFLDFKIFKKCIDDLGEFDKDIHMLKLYKDGEPLINPNFVEMVKYARSKPWIKCIMVTTNGTRLTPELSQKLVKSGIDRIHISLEGLSTKSYKTFTKTDIDFDALVKKIAYLYSIRGKCEVSVKVLYENLAPGEEEKFHKIFKNICDSYYIEHISPVWPTFDMAKLGSFKESVYQTKTKKLEVCPYLFYQMAVNSDGVVSACCVDWKREVVVGDVKTASLLDIWNGQLFNDLRIKNLEKRRSEIPYCGNCGQLAYATQDDIDEEADKILKRMGSNKMNGQK
jgi:MoaA/NifB/PqqE/SkfB family radical SAM enzyme